IAQAEVVLLLSADVQRAVVLGVDGTGRVGIVVSPRVLLAVSAPAAGALPLGFRGEALSFPGAEGRAVVPVHVDHRPLFHSRGDLAVTPLVGRLMASRLHKRSVALVRDFGL